MAASLGPAIPRWTETAVRSPSRATSAPLGWRRDPPSKRAAGPSEPLEVIAPTRRVDRRRGNAEGSAQTTIPRPRRAPAGAGAARTPAAAGRPPPRRGRRPPRPSRPRGGRGRSRWRRDHRVLTTGRSWSRPHPEDGRRLVEIPDHHALPPARGSRSRPGSSGPSSRRRTPRLHQPGRLVRGHPLDLSGLVGAEPALHLLHVGEDQQRVASTSAARIAAARSLSTTPSTPISRGPSSTTGTPPPPDAITITPSATSRGSTGASTIEYGSGDGTTRRHPPCGSGLHHPAALALEPLRLVLRVEGPDRFGRVRGTRDRPGRTRVSVRTVATGRSIPRSKNTSPIVTWSR